MFLVTCSHDQMVPARSFGVGTLDDTRTHHGYCTACDTWVSVTVFLASGGVDSRPLTPTEIERCASSV